MASTGQAITRSLEVCNKRRRRSAPIPDEVLAIPTHLDTATEDPLRNDCERSEIGRQLVHGGFVPIRVCTPFFATGHLERHLEMPRNSIATILRFRGQVVGSPVPWCHGPYSLLNRAQFVCVERRRAGASRTRRHDLTVRGHDHVSLALPTVATRRIEIQPPMELLRRIRSARRDAQHNHPSNDAQQTPP